VLDVLGVRRRLDRRDHPVEQDRDRPAGGATLGVEGGPGSDLHPLGLRVEVSRRPVPALALTPVHRQLHDVAVGAVEGLVAVEDRLDPVATGRELGERVDRVAEDAGVDDRRLARAETLDVDAEDLDRRDPGRDLEPGLGRALGFVLRQQQDHPAVERPGRSRLGVGDGEGETGSGGRGSSDPSSDERHQNRAAPSRGALSSSRLRSLDGSLRPSPRSLAGSG
jgi:hypothetical protein